MFKQFKPFKSSNAFKVQRSRFKVQRTDKVPPFKQFKSFKPSNAFNRCSRAFFLRRSAMPGLFPNTIQVARLLKLLYKTRIDEVTRLGLHGLRRILADFFQRRLDRFGADVRHDESLMACR